MSEMVERVARALVDGLWPDLPRMPDGATPMLPAYQYEKVMATARKIIGAMHKPTEKMVDAGTLEDHRESVRQIWGLMIDVALDSQPPSDEELFGSVIGLR